MTVKQVFTPWCINCEATSKQVEKLAKHYKGSSNLIFARIDASANEHPKLQVSVIKNFVVWIFLWHETTVKAVVWKLMPYIPEDALLIVPLFGTLGEWLSNTPTLQSKW